MVAVQGMAAYDVLLHDAQGWHEGNDRGSVPPHVPEINRSAEHDELEMQGMHEVVVVGVHVPFK